MSIRELGGGVSNIVLLVEGGAPEGEPRRWVVKQSLEKLRVEDDWRSERSRIFHEANAIRALGPVLGQDAVPQVVHIGREDYLYVMTAAPPGSVMWKEALLQGQVDMGVARRAGALLARMIGSAPSAMHRSQPPSPNVPFSTNSASIPITGRPPRAARRCAGPSRS